MLKYCSYVKYNNIKHKYKDTLNIEMDELDLEQQDQLRFMDRKLRLLLLIIPLVINISCQNNPHGNWDIKNGEMVHDLDNSNSTGAQQYWSTFYNLFPQAPIDQYVHGFKLWTDGPLGEMGGLSSIDTQNKSWLLDIDTDDMNLDSKNKEHIEVYMHTLIHEYGHLITLNYEQIEPTLDEVQNNEKGYLTSEGYARPNSYLADFVDQFWYDDLLLQWDDIWMIEDLEIRSDELYYFYERNREEFLTDYAAENPEEDLAESWYFFITNDSMEAHPKIAFFYQYPELVKYRTEIRKNMKTFGYN